MPPQPSPLARQKAGSMGGIAFEKVCKSYGGTRILDDLDLEISQGELFVLIGSSGSGKTTVLRMANRLIDPDRGKITVFGRDISGVDPIQLRRNTGYVIQQIGLFPHLTVAGNIGLIAKLEGVPSSLVQEKVASLLSMVRLPPDQFMNRYPRELSGGQQQRVGLARSLLMDPPLLLMDEPFGALDPVLRHQLQEEFLRIRKNLNKTILFVTHDIEEAFRLGDRIRIISGGRLLQTGTPEDLLLHPESDAISALLGLERRLSYIEHITVRSLMVNLEILPKAEGDLKIASAQQVISRSDYDFLLVMISGQVEGAVALRDLLEPADSEEPLITKMKTLPVFPPDTSGYDALKDMKQRGVSLALVGDIKRKSGLLIMDEVIRRML